jgi:hypothetical protein
MLGGGEEEEEINDDDADFKFQEPIVCTMRKKTNDCHCLLPFESKNLC